MENLFPKKRKAYKSSLIPRDRKNLMRTRKRKLTALARARSPSRKDRLSAEVRELEKLLKSSYETELAKN